MPAVVNHAILQVLPLYAKERNLMAKKMTPAQRRQHYDARGPAPADNRPAILPVTLSVSDTATLKLQRACVTASPAGIAAIIRELNLC
ncbi:hypothetical protein [Escherichia coli]|uniref:hypothetical protein n=1 Tax=Escherichia coli TaxID=562 RepID=UPI001FCE73DA|nr:hypothetical protein [Escherichia coli]